MTQKTTERSTDLKVMTGSVGSSSKLTIFRTSSGMPENSPESKSYCGSSIGDVCPLEASSFSPVMMLGVILDRAVVFSSVGVDIFAVEFVRSEVCSADGLRELEQHRTLPRRNAACTLKYNRPQRNPTISSTPGEILNISSRLSTSLHIIG